MDYNWYPSIQAPTIQTAPTSPYTPHYGANTQAGSMIGQVGQYLTPYTPLSDSLPYEQYAAPTRAAYDQYEKTMLRPYFDRFTANPWTRDYANNSAANSSFMMGSAAKRYRDDRTQMMAPYQDQVRQGRDALEQMITQGWQQQLQKAGSSPTAMTNIGTANPALSSTFNYKPTY